MTSLNPQFIELLEKSLGKDLSNIVLLNIDLPPVTSLRLNAGKSIRWKPNADLLKGRVAWYDKGCYLTSRPQFTFDPLLHAGVYYVQEASSMFLGHIISFLLNNGGMEIGKEPLKVLDICAAPGGKSGVLTDTLPEGSLVVSNEIVPLRAAVLRENIIKQGSPDVIVTSDDSGKWAKMGEMFDIVVVDAPCSGEGMFRKDDNARELWTRENVLSCARLQREIVKNAWQTLKEGGVMIYSTCAFNRLENEDNVRYILEQLGGELIDIPVNGSWQITGVMDEGLPCGVFRFLFGKTEGEGLFMAAIRKTSRSREHKPQKRKNIVAAQTSSIYTGALTGGEDFVLRLVCGETMAIPRRWAEVFNNVFEHCNVLYAGVGVERSNGAKVTPHEALAFSQVLKREAFQYADLPYQEALAYLSHQALRLGGEVSKGYALVGFKGQPLGFVKNLGTRANNLYPKPWAIRTTHLPQDYEAIVERV